jgi:nucleoside-diphosphate-sugar epimerase
MKVIVTGATGFMGRNLSERLGEDGHQITATGRSLAVGKELRNKGIDFKPADLLDAEGLIEAFSPVDRVVHCAGKSGDWGRYRDYYRVNVAGTRNVLKACHHHGIEKLIFISSPSLYFNGRHRLDVREDEPLPPKQATAYARTKLMAEHLLFDPQQNCCQVISLRPRVVFGPYDSTFVPRILRMSAKKTFPLIDKGQALVAYSPRFGNRESFESYRQWYQSQREAK